MNTILGACSICGGDVIVPGIWYGVQPPRPTCNSCGAVKARRVIQMEHSHRGIGVGVGFVRDDSSTAGWRSS